MATNSSNTSGRFPSLEPNGSNTSFSPIWFKLVLRITCHLRIRIVGLGWIINEGMNKSPCLLLLFVMGRANSPETVARKAIIMVIHLLSGPDEMRVLRWTLGTRQSFPMEIIPASWRLSVVTIFGCCRVQESNHLWANSVSLS